MTKITSSVGLGGINATKDVRLVQQLLNNNRPFPLRAIAVDGRIGKETIAAIQEFQNRAVHLSRPDGRVDPRGTTLKALDKSGPGAGIPSLKTKPTASVADDAASALKAFEADHPILTGKAYLTSGSRTWQEQLDIILQPKRANNYTNIKDRFKTKFKLKDLPAARNDLSSEQLSWWETEILAQAGKSPGFPHVGGKAQDISVKNLGLDDKKKLQSKVEEWNLQILFELVTGDTSDYGVSISDANVFHTYR